MVDPVSVSAQKLGSDASGQDSPARARASEHLIALTQDAALQEALQSVVPPEALVFVNDEPELALQLLTGRAGVVVLDTAANLGAAQVSQLAQRLHAQLPDLALIVAGDTAEQVALAPLVTSGTIYRFLHTPVSAQRVKLFVDAAWRRHESSAAASGSFPILKTGHPKRGIAGGLIALIIAGVAGIALAGWWLQQQRAPPPPRPAPPKSAAVAPAPAPVPKPVQPAQPAPAPPPPSTAALALRQLDIDATAAEQALLIGDYAEAARWTEAARAIDPNHVRVVFLTAQLAKLRREGSHSRAASSRAKPAAAAPAALARTATFSSASAQAASAGGSQDAAMRQAAGSPAQAPVAAPGSQPGANAGAAAATASRAAQGRSTTIPAQKIYAVEPEYPLAARELDLTGSVDVEFTVRADGTVADVSIRHAEPKGVFDKSALAAVRQWRFRPAQRDGHPVDQRAQVRLRFAYQ